MSCSVTPTLTTRSGSSVTVVSPNLCGTVTGKAASPDVPDVGVGVGSLAADGSSDEHDALSREPTSRGSATASILRMRMDGLSVR